MKLGCIYSKNLHCKQWPSQNSSRMRDIFHKLKREDAPFDRFMKRKDTFGQKSSAIPNILQTHIFLIITEHLTWFFWNIGAPAFSPKLRQCQRTAMFAVQCILALAHLWDICAYHLHYEIFASAFLHICMKWVFASNVHSGASYSSQEPEHFYPAKLNDVKGPIAFGVNALWRKRLNGIPFYLLFYHNFDISFCDSKIETIPSFCRHFFGAFWGLYYYFACFWYY